MPKAPGLDHIVLCVRDLDAARERFEALGFTTTPPAKHPFGTGNSLAQMGSSFIELLSVIEPQRIPPHAEGSFSFGAHNAAFLERREGMSMLVLSSEDARHDEARWRSGGLHTFEPVYFERKATLPDGSEAKVAFTIAFAVNEAIPDAVFFCCQQHAPEAFWQPAYQRHANGAADLSSVTLVADHPQGHAAFFETLLGHSRLKTHPRGLEASTGLGHIEVIATQQVAARFPQAAASALSSGAGFVAAAVGVADIDATAQILESSGVSHTRTDQRLVVPATECFGMTLEFVGSSA
jgi:catechol 2,3-dioxygenase-like lactoylglutathione lyase family enzyme